MSDFEDFTNWVAFKAYDPAKHPHNPKGSPAGGEFAPKAGGAATGGKFTNAAGMAGGEVKPFGKGGDVVIYEHPAYRAIHDMEKTDKEGLHLSAQYPESMFKPQVVFSSLRGFTKFDRPFRLNDFTQAGIDNFPFYYQAGKKLPLSEKFTKKWQKHEDSLVPNDSH